MKPVDPQDKPKLIVLILLSVVVLGYGLLQLTTGLADASPKPSRAKASERGSGSQTVAGTPEVATAPTDALSVIPDPSAGDPFLPRFALEAASASASGGSTPAPGQPLPVLPDSVLASLGRPGATAPGLPQAKTTKDSAASGKIEPVELAPPPPPSLNVAGLLVAEAGSGGKSVAILAGSGEKRYVTAGDPIGNGYVVASVTLGGVEVVDPNNRSRRFTFSLPKR